MNEALYNVSSTDNVNGAIERSILCVCVAQASTKVNMTISSFAVKYVHIH